MARALTKGAVLGGNGDFLVLSVFGETQMHACAALGADHAAVAWELTLERFLPPALQAGKL